MKKIWKKKSTEKKGGFGFLHNIIDQVNKKYENEGSNESKNEALIPEDEKEKENEDIKNDDNVLSTGGMKMKGPTKLRAKRKLKTLENLYE